ncbi:hypothetical protein IQ238_26300 [Pleurocapsales cyanobacterium LEGE 06147]|nr:hypothetical protein [Pleurocapsales cyanobacterium LEGE 06147]
MFDLIVSKLGKDNVSNFRQGEEYGIKLNYYYFMYQEDEFVEIWFNGFWFGNIDNFRVAVSKNLDEVLDKLKEELSN